MGWTPNFCTWPVRPWINPSAFPALSCTASKYPTQTELVTLLSTHLFLFSMLSYFILEYSWLTMLCFRCTAKLFSYKYISLVQFSRSVVSDSLQPHESQHARPSCPSPTAGVHSDSPFSSCPQSLPASESFPMSQLFAWGGQNWSFSFSIIPSKEIPGLISFRMDWLDLLAVQGTPKSLLQHHTSKASFFRHSAFFTVQLSHPYMTTGKTIALTRWTFVGKVIYAFEYAI